jgi:hypothetical protein
VLIRNLPKNTQIMLGSFFRKSNPEQHVELNLPHADKTHHSEIAHPHTPTEQDIPIVIPPTRPAILSTENVALIAIILLLLMTGLLSINILSCNIN